VRLPNPRVAIPVLVSAAAGAVVGYFVTDASCAPGSCHLAAAIVAVAVAVGAGLGVGIVVILAVRSFAEWRIQSERSGVITVEATSDGTEPPAC